ncbi:lanthionine synthetase C family protein [Polymorphospora sp. NPDC050346]|uniref:lanthionine synthetase C family protein n=1 Tax=Polymorphospora sp. NPDC050346 TaxID=3155780 RepID=UPI0033FCF798
MTVELAQQAGRIAAGVADRLATPDLGQAIAEAWWPQSLAHGAAGVALLHAERAAAGEGPWERAHDWLACAVEGGVVGGADSHLYHGVVATAFAVHAAGRVGRYQRASATLDARIDVDTRVRLDLAHARIDAGRRPALAEYDAIRGLTGIGAYLLRRHPDGDLVRRVLSYLVRLTEPADDGGERVPGWWTDLAPSGKPSPAFPGGHGNLGVAHGIGGPLALLALSLRHGVRVDGQVEAIGRICAHLDQWRQHTTAGQWWPYWITRAQWRDGHPGAGPARPSWCYGTAGLARAQQLAALAVGDGGRQAMAETALVAALTDPIQVGMVTDRSLCHGTAGLLHLARVAAADAASPDLAEVPRRLLTTLLDDPGSTPVALLGGGDIGLLEGAAGVALALHTAYAGTAAVSGWDSCLLIT